MHTVRTVTLNSALRTQLSAISLTTINEHSHSELSITPDRFGTHFAKQTQPLGQDGGGREEGGGREKEEGGWGAREREEGEGEYGAREREKGEEGLGAREREEGEGGCGARGSRRSRALGGCIPP